MVSNLPNKNLCLRIIFLLISLTPLFYFESFYNHFYSYLTGSIITQVIAREWQVVAASIILFIAFLIPLSYRRKVNWKEYGLVSAFFVSLFVEMYGIPLTLIFTSNFFIQGALFPETVFTFNFLGAKLAADIAMIYGAILMLSGSVFILLGWITLYQTLKKGKLVTRGIYSVSRHPQYFGFILIILGWLVGWPTILTLIFSPILIYMYVKVCKKEESELSIEFPKYKEYMKKVPFFI